MTVLETMKVFLQIESIQGNKLLYEKPAQQEHDKMVNNFRTSIKITIHAILNSFTGISNELKSFGYLFSVYVWGKQWENEAIFALSEKIQLIFQICTYNVTSARLTKHSVFPSLGNLLINIQINMTKRSVILRTIHSVVLVVVILID